MLSAADAGIRDITFLHMQYRGMIDVKGGDDKPLIKPWLSLDGKAAPLGELCWNRLNWWIPTFNASTSGIVIRGTILSPIGERGFIYRLSLTNSKSSPISLSSGLSGSWASCSHRINEDKSIEAKKYVYHSNWNNGIVFDLKNDITIFSFAPMASHSSNVAYTLNGDSIEYTITCDLTLEPGENQAIDFFWGFGFEEVASTTSAKEMMRQGYNYELKKTLDWLEKRSHRFKNALLDDIYNLNLFFNLFFSTGVTLDTEEFVLVTSRSPRYYVSAAYWDRDSLFWSFPSILQSDDEYARMMLEYVFTKQIRNAGIHSRYIDGTVLEPGFELDELCAPIIALHQYITKTNNREYLREPYIQKGICSLLKTLKEKKHPTIDLFETFLQPTDDMHVYRYLTYDNVLVWRSLKYVAELFDGILDHKMLSEIAHLADCVRNAIREHCIKTKQGKRLYAWSVDLDDNFDIYDEPPGSLQLLHFHGFCENEDEVFSNTVDVIRSSDYAYSFADSKINETGCPHAPHPWVLSIANSLLYGRIEHCLGILSEIKMDNGIACESVDENTGECVTGAAFATCAGFLSYAIRKAMG